MLLLSHRVNQYLHQAKATDGVITDDVIKEGNTARALMSCFGWMLPQVSTYPDLTSYILT